jgi:hypothetical protein
MSDFTYEAIYLLEALTNIAFKAAFIYLINKYIEIRSVKQ